MKKKRKIILIASIAAALSVFFALAACSAYSVWIDPTEETDTVFSPEHAGEEEPSDESSSLSDKPNEESSLNAGGDNENEDPVETTEPESEEETEEEVEELPSLEFTSLGNGTCCVTGIGTVTSSYIVIPQKSPEGEVVAEIAEKAFYSYDFIRAVEIPSTVSVIGDMAFADCPELVYIAVDKSNKMFTDIGGILYSSDMSRVVAYPAANGASSITLPTSVKIIAPMAFYGCNSLKTIHYEGSFEDWSKISVGEMNYSLYTASIVCKEAK